MSTVTPLRGRPRDERVTEAILDAVVELLADRSPAAVTMREIADRAGVGLPSLYRRWPTKDELLVEAVTHAASAASPTPDTGRLRSDLIAMARAVAKALAGSGRDALTVALATGQVPGTEDLRVQVQLARRRANRVVVQRAVERHELAPDVDADLLLDMLHGPLWLERLTSGHAPDVSRLEDLVDAVLRAFPAPPAPRGSKPIRRA